MFASLLLVGTALLGVGVVWFFHRRRKEAHFPPFGADLDPFFDFPLAADFPSQSTQPAPAQENPVLENPTPAPPPAPGTLRRAVGYCLIPTCEDYHKGIFLLNHRGEFLCPRCRQPGLLEAEKGEYSSECPCVAQVRLEFNFDPAIRAYRGLAVVRDEELLRQEKETCTYLMRSPLVRTDKRALKVVEATLSTLQRVLHREENGVPPRYTETLLTFDQDRPAFLQECQKLEAELSGSNLARRSTRA